jgi:hypothetical protein
MDYPKPENVFEYSWRENDKPNLRFLEVFLIIHFNVPVLVRERYMSSKFIL